jgi:hypothetical protein
MVSRCVTPGHTVVFVLHSVCLSTPYSPEVVHSCHTIVNSTRIVTQLNHLGLRIVLQSLNKFTGTVIHMTVSQRSVTEQVEKYVA